MTHAALSPDIGREFDPFLFASVGEDRHGQLLSVISVLARSDLDPRLEAVGLARMSQGQATARLCGLIAALLDGLPWVDSSTRLLASWSRSCPKQTNWLGLPRPRRRRPQRF